MATRFFTRLIEGGSEEHEAEIRKSAPYLNRLSLQLQRGNPWIGILGDAYQRMRSEFQIAELPFPIRYYIADALTVHAWNVFLRLDPDLWKQDMLAEAAGRRESWAAFFKSDSAWRSEESSRPLKACDLASTEAHWETFVRMMFFPTGHDRVRIMHVVWADFLAARYLALCFRFGHFAELGPLGCRRPMVRDAADPSRADLRRELADVYRGILAAYGERRSGDWRADPGLVSVAASYLLAYGGNVDPPTARSILADLCDRIDQALPLVANVKRNPPAPDESHESIQASFVTLVESIAARNRVINVLHYLYYLVSAKARSAQIPQVDDFLDRVFCDDNGAADLVRRSGIPYLVDLFDVLRSIWNQTRHPAVNSPQRAAPWSK